MSVAEILSNVSLVCYILGGIGLFLAVFFWFRFKILSVINDLSGRTARLARAANMKAKEERGGKGYKPSRVNATRGKVTASINKEKSAKQPQNQQSPQQQRQNRQSKMDEQPETGLLRSNGPELAAAAQTEMLVPDVMEGTELLGTQGLEGTELLTDSNETTLLEADRTNSPVGKKLVMLEEVIMIHTDEKI